MQTTTVLHPRFTKNTHLPSKLHGSKHRHSDYCGTGSDCLYINLPIKDIRDFWPKFSTVKCILSIFILNVVRETEQRTDTDVLARQIINFSPAHIITSETKYWCNCGWNTDTDWRFPRQALPFSGRRLVSLHCAHSVKLVCGFLVSCPSKMHIT